MTIDQELLHDVAAQVRWMLGSRRTPTTWQRFEEALAALQKAHAAGDTAAVEKVLYELELLSRRVSEKLGQEPEEPTPRVRDRANELVHTLLPDEAEEDA
ncbi:hypothetical protein BBK82_40465 [Lentzea guizhouensis]|uniref:CATRA-Associated Small Protein domain-containing protein n=1 Tax=Lentzea guizhouensis TaxID=1586287 RepID=A0A1B2HUA9_9PSEU|nr:CATRA system-associated protein [Lentzea guizhouensis]ANZ41311.1 hypothetical protein BBK82_40465 [Lentzea guizhouensis]